MKKNVRVTKIKITDDNFTPEKQNSDSLNPKVTNKKQPQLNFSPIKISTPKPATYILIQNGRQRQLPESTGNCSSVPTSLKPFSILTDSEIAPILAKVEFPPA